MPKCMGGGNDVWNIVELTGEEHYVAHQLLVKMYPSVSGLALAAMRMARQCTGNKSYAWLRRLVAEAARERQTGKKLPPKAHSAAPTCRVRSREIKMLLGCADRQYLQNKAKSCPTCGKGRNGPRRRLLKPQRPIEGNHARQKPERRSVTLTAAGSCRPLQRKHAPSCQRRVSANHIRQNISRKFLRRISENGALLNKG